MNIDHHAGIDPAGAFTAVRDNFLLYIQTAFSTRFPGLERERERLLRREGTFCQEPWIEPLPRYEGSRKTIHDLDAADLPGLPEAARRDFKDLAACGLVGAYELHLHQVDMLRTALSGRHCVVTAGTGSGKTEAFLLPLFAYLAKESPGWSAPGPLPAHWDDWWRNRNWHDQCNPIVGKRHRMIQSYRVPQRGHESEGRNPALRAIVLYPMNALVEDQLTRLRRALTSPAAEQWYVSRCPGNRIYFGRYNGNTPVAGHEHTKKGRPDSKRIKDLARQLYAMDKAVAEAERKAAELELPAREARKQGKPVPRAAREAERLAEDTRYFFPRLDRGEMRCRWDMQDAPPDILITNNSMLSIMLMRDADDPIFTKTRQWLEKDGSLFHLIIDELHLYRGTAGTEVAYLLRLLLARLNLTPSHPKLRILASSASLQRDADSLRFLSEFFGSRWEEEQIIPGYPRSVEPVTGSAFWPAAPFIALSQCADDAASDAAAACTAIAAAVGGPTGGDPVQALKAALESKEACTAERMLQASTGADPSTGQPQTRAVSLRHFAAGLFGPDVLEGEALQAARGLLIARGLCDREGESSTLPSFRLHWFFRNLEGLWACTRPGCQSEGSEAEEERTSGRLYASGRILCDHPHTPHRVLELLYCEQCGTTFFGGSRLTLQDNNGWELLNTDPDIEGIPDRQQARFVALHPTSRGPS